MAPVAKRGERLDGEFRHVLRRCSKLNDAEIRLLAIIGSLSSGITTNYDGVCNWTGWSRAKLKRTIQSLLRYGLIERTYTKFKHVRLTIVPGVAQAEFANAHYGSPVSHNPGLTNEPVTGQQRTHDGSSMNHSNIERELERKLETTDFNESKKGGLIPLKLGDAVRLMEDAKSKKTVGE